MNAVRAMGGTAEIVLDILVQSPLWRKEPEAETVARRAIAGAAEEASSGGAEIAIVLTDDSAIRALNRQWRGQDKSTNVLSFPTAKAAGQAAASEARSASEPRSRRVASPWIWHTRDSVTPRTAPISLRFRLSQ